MVQLTAVGLLELIANSADEYLNFLISILVKYYNNLLLYDKYESLAVKYATDRELYQQLRQKLIENVKNKSLFNNKEWVENFEKGLQEIWRRHEEQHPLEDVLV